MQRRTRKLVGTIAMLVFVCVYALVVMALAQAGLPEMPKASSCCSTPPSASAGSSR